MIKINEIQAKTCDISADADHSLTDHEPNNRVKQGNKQLALLFH